MEQFNPSDKVTLDIPLFIRLLEYAREDAKTDMDLHNVAEKAIAASETGKTLTMADYDGLVAGNSEDQEMNEIKRMQQLAGVLNEEIFDYDWGVGVNIGSSNPSGLKFYYDKEAKQIRYSYKGVEGILQDNDKKDLIYFLEKY